MRPFFFKPGQQLITYEVYRKKASRDDRGHVSVETQPELIETVRGTIAQAGQTEREQWNQQGHPITHRIVIVGRVKADAGDEVRTGNKVYHVQGKHDPMELGFFSTLYCFERLDATPKGEREKK